MSDISKSVPTLAASLLQRQALTSKSTIGSTATATSSAVTVTKLTGATAGEGPADLNSGVVHKQNNSVKQGNEVLPQTSAAATNKIDALTKAKLNPPPPPPLIPTTTTQMSGTTAEHSYASQPPVSNGTDTAKKTETPGKSSSDSSSDDSSSDSSGSSGDESDNKEEKSVVPVKVDSAVPGPSGVARRGRPRGRPRLGTSTPRTSKQAIATIKDQKARTTPRKRSGRIPKPAVVFSPDIAGGKAALPKRRGRGCGGCPGCLQEDCGKCNYCKDKTKFGGPGRKKQRCALRVCANFVKALHGKSHLANPAGTPPREVAVIPVTKLASSSKVEEVIEQLRKNLTSSIPPVIDKDSVPITATSMQSFIISQPQPLKTTPAAMTTVAASETKIVGPVTTPITSSKGEAPSNHGTPTTSATAVTSAPAISLESKTSEIALRTRRKQQQQQLKEKDKGTLLPASLVKCIMCGRERKLSLMRSNQFCTQRCINAWMEKNAKGAGLTAKEGSQAAMDVDKPTTTTSATPQSKKLPRALKNLQIDMAWDRTTTSGVVRPPTYITPTVAATQKPTMTSTPTPTATTAANKRPTASTGVKPTAAKKTSKDDEVTVGTKRPSQQPVQGQKKMKEADPAKAVSFNLNTIPTSTVDPIAAPPLSRTVPPPSISIVPLDQLTALGTALITHQQQQQRAKKEEATAAAKLAAPKFPTGLPVDVRSWTITQVVKFFESTTDCKDYAAMFHDQEVDGTALLLLTHESLVKCLGIKLGRALKIMVHVEELQKLYA